MESNLTLDMKDALYLQVNKQGTFMCFEVTIGWFGKERVDMLTYDTNKVWKCYEIKSNKKDFYSKNKHTFVGHYNYYVMPIDLYEEVKDSIPNEIGVYLYSITSRPTNITLIKKARKKTLLINESILIDSMIRSLSRDACREYKRNKRNRFPINPGLDLKGFNNRIKRIEENKKEYLNHIKKQNSYLEKNRSLNDWLEDKTMIEEDINIQISEMRNIIQEYYSMLKNISGELDKLEE